MTTPIRSGTATAREHEQLEPSPSRLAIVSDAPRRIIRWSRFRSERVELHPIPPFDLDLALRYLAAWPATVIEQVEGGVWQRAVRIGGQELILALRSVGTPRRPRLSLEIHGRELDAGLVGQAIAMVKRAFAVEVDPKPFFGAVRADPVLRELVERLGSVRPLTVIDPFEAVVWGILCQQINLAFGRRLKTALIDLCGATLAVGGESYTLFPRPQDVIDLDPAVLRALQYSRQKTAYIKEAAAAILSGRLDFALLATLKADEVMARLTAIKGIGRWTAEYVMLRVLGFPDAIAAADAGLRRVIGRAYGLGRTASEKEVREIARRWDGWRGWAAFYWWMEALLAVPEGFDKTAQSQYLDHNPARRVVPHA